MKLKTTIAACAGLLFAVSSFGQSLINFNSTGADAVVDSRTGNPTAAGVAIAGLYFTTDLGATEDPNAGTDAFQLGATVAIGPFGPLQGVYNGGVVDLGLPEGTPVLVQVRAWSVGFASYAEAFASGSANVLVGRSGIGQVNLGGGSLPTPSLSGVSGVAGFDITPVPEPSTIVLGLVGGLGALVLLRRRK